jgi:uncharacterized membrane protein
MRPRTATAVYLLASAAGLFFTAWSTSDLVQHLDRQVHSIHCSFIPGLAAADASGTSGCHVALMSPYSSVFRSAVWGGIPATLAGMAVFAYLLYRGVRLVLEDQQLDRARTRYLVAATLLPVLTSLVYGYIALVELDALCKLCMGIYLSSFTAFGAAIAMARAASAEPDDEAEAEAQRNLSGIVITGIGEGTGFVLLAVALYVAHAPDFSDTVGKCGELTRPDDTAKVMVPLGPQGAGPVAIEVLDPLCPACSGFERRLSASGLASQLSRKALLFPLDSTCNWMVSSAIHPGACTVSEAVLCADQKADAVLAWAFDHQEEIRTASAANPDAAATMVKAAFPELATCLGSDKIKQRLNRSLRWAVSNELPVLTPQLYVDGKKLCDEDTDLGLDWALPRLLATRTAKVTP